MVVADVLKETASKEVWGLRLLRNLEWKRFEMLCAGALEAAGYLVWSTVIENDDVVDLVVSSPNPADGGKRTAVRCLSFDGSVVGIGDVRAIAGLVDRGLFANAIVITAGVFSPEAMAYAEEKDERVILLEGPEFLSRIMSLSRDTRDALFEETIEGDYATPTCPSCGKAMVRGAAADGLGGEGQWRCFDSGNGECRVLFPVIDPGIAYPPVVEVAPPKKGWILTVRRSTGEEERYTIRDLMDRCFGGRRSDTAA